MILIFTLLVIFLLVSLGLFIGLSRTQPPIKIAFLVLSFSLALWTLSNTLADYSTKDALQWTRLAFSSAACAAGGLGLLTLWFPERLRYKTATWSVVIMLATAIIALLSMTSLVVPSVDIQDGFANVVTGSLYPLYVVFVIALVLVSVSILVWRSRHSSGDKLQRIRYIMYGAGSTALFMLTTNLILPLFTGENSLAVYGSIGVVFFISLVAFTIVRHNLFSIRSATARATAYILSGVTLGGIFFAVMFVVDSVLFNNINDPFAQRVFYMLSAVFIGFTFPVIGEFFDRITRRIFLRDTYDPREILTSSAKIISATSNSKDLVARLASFITNEVNLTHAEIYLKNDSHWKREAASGDKDFTKMLKLTPLFSDSAEGVKDVTDLDVSVEVYEKVALLVPLRTSQGALGYMALGYKRNGSGFNQTDHSVIGAIANEAGIALESHLRFEEIQSLNESLQQRIDDATKKLQRSNDKLQRLDETKDEFLSMASHQLRTPLTSIKGYLSMTLEGDMGAINDQQRKVLQQAYESSQRMVFLIGDFLNISRLKTGKFVIEYHTINLADMAEQEVGQLADTAKSRGISLKYDKPHKFPDIQGDENKLHQVMMNFMDNAIYYSLTNTTINVQLYVEGQSLVFKVKDQGIGVPKEAQAKLFTKFYRANNAKQQRPDGTGIGLYMAKKVIVAHGGAIIFETKQGEGSTFGFKLPLKRKTK